MPGLLRGVARTAVIAGTATAVSNRVSRRQGNAGKPRSSSSTTSSSTAAAAVRPATAAPRRPIRAPTASPR